MTKIYLSGPMSGILDHNYPLFNRITSILRHQGFDVVNPAELDETVEPGSQPWEWYLRRDLKALLECDVVVLLPEWRNSRGARLEVDVAHRLKMHVLEMDINTGAFKRTRLGNKSELVFV